MIDHKRNDKNERMVEKIINYYDDQDFISIWKEGEFVKWDNKREEYDFSI